jgi:hypothetical protein
VTAQYLVLAIELAVTLNHRNRFVRAVGTLLVAIGLAFIVLSIYLADTDGTFAALPPGSFRPQLLNAQAAVALMAIVFLLWATWRQLRRPMTAEVPWRNTGATYGVVSRWAHWATATADFVAVHETLGITLLVLVLARLAWLARSAPPALSPSLRR